MSLSEHEQQQLDEIERGLRGIDQRREAAPTAPRLDVRRALRLGGAGAAVGLALVLTGLVTKTIVVSVVGFVVLVTTGVLATTTHVELHVPWRRSARAGTSARPDRGEWP